MPNVPSKHIRADRLGDNLNRRKLQNGDSVAIAVDEVVALDSVNNALGHLTAKKAIADGTHLQSGSLYICRQVATAVDTVDRGNKGAKFWATKTAVIAADTSAGTRGDPVYLSTTAGGWTLTAPATLALKRRIGQVLVAATVVNGGLILIEPDVYLNDNVGAQELYTVMEATVQLADLPSDPAALVQLGTLPANQPVVGVFLKVNADPDPGASGISSLKCGISGAGVTFMDVNIFGDVGSPLYHTSSSDPGDFEELPHVHPTSVAFYYTLLAVGADLDQMTAFDVTFYVLVANQVI